MSTSEEHDAVQLQVARALAGLDEVTELLKEKLQVCAAHVKAGNLTEAALMAKVMELSQGVQGAFS